MPLVSLHQWEAQLNIVATAHQPGQSRFVAHGDLLHVRREASHAPFTVGEPFDVNA